MGTEDICHGSFRLPAIVKEYYRGEPELEKDIGIYCSYSPSKGDICVSPSPQQQEFCAFQDRVIDLGLQLNAQRQEYVRWAEKAEKVWNKETKRWGVVDSVATNSWGEAGWMHVRIDVSEDGTQILLVPYLAGEDGRILDAGFDVWRSTPQQAEQWFEEILGQLPRIFGGCASRQAVVEMKDNRIVDDLSRCWVDGAGKAFSEPWLAWAVGFHNFIP